MKDQLEQSIKESLQGFEAPYNPAAWDAMRAQLDAKMPVNSPPKGGSAKWFIAAAVIGGIGVGSYFLLNTNEDAANNPHSEEITAQSEEEISGSETFETQAENSAVSSSENNAGSSAQNAPHHNTADATPNPVNGGHLNVTTSQNGNESNGAGNAEAANNTPQGNRVQTTQANDPKAADVKLPELEDVCQHSVISIANTNKVPLVLIGPDTYQMIQARETVKVRMKKAGTYVLSEYKNEKSKKVEFEVKDAPIADFSIDPMTKFEDGLPTTKLEANVPGTQFEWIINNERAYGAQADAHFYRQGTHEVTLVVTGANGCEALQTKTVYIEDNYNLMAPTSFRPLSSDMAVNKFIPYALKERNVNFRMIIVDPADGHVIFETKDASMGWDGIDRKTGQLVPFEHVYIWKVTLDKAAKFEERTEYSGQVIPVRAN